MLCGCLSIRQCQHGVSTFSGQNRVKLLTRFTEQMASAAHALTVYTCAAADVQVGAIPSQGMRKYHMRDVGVCKECLSAAYSSKLGAGWSDWSYRVELDLDSYVVPAFGSAAGQRSLRVTHPAGTSSGLDLRLADGFAAVGELQFDMYALVTTGAYRPSCPSNSLRLRISTHAVRAGRQLLLLHRLRGKSRREQAMQEP